MGNLNTTNICRKDNTAELKQSGRFLECIDDNFLAQVIEKMMKGGAFLDLKIITNDELVRNVKAGGSLGPREMVVFVILKGGNREKERSRRAG